MKLSISIVIPTFNGLSLLKKYLPSVIAHSHGAPIIVVDDASSDDSVIWLTKTYPQIKVVSLQYNQGFSGAVNRGFQQAETELVMLLNNDVKLHANTIPILAKHFENNSSLFAVGAREILPSGQSRGRSRGEFARDLLIHSGANSLESGPTPWVFAASGMFRKKIWASLDGLDELYAPAYWEDIDISYRAWKAGYTCWFDTTATLEHQAEVTMNSTLGWRKQVIAFRNQTLFFWKNVSELKLIFNHLIWIGFHLLLTSIRTKGAFLYGFIWAIWRMPQVTSQNTTKVKNIRTDQQILDLSSKI